MTPGAPFLDAMLEAAEGKLPGGFQGQMLPNLLWGLCVMQVCPLATWRALLARFAEMHDAHDGAVTDAGLCQVYQVLSASRNPKSKT